MRVASFTIDVDRDVNTPIPGQMDAGSCPVDGDPSPRFRSTAAGLEAIVKLLDEIGIKGTFFMEAETAAKLSESYDLPSMLSGHEVACHGWAHEDLTGRLTGIGMDDIEVRDILRHSRSALKDIFGTAVEGFRAPYLECNDIVLDAVAASGFRYDSSLKRDIVGGRLLPSLMPNGLAEFPVARSRDRNGKVIVSYLWPFHEGERTVEDYVCLGKGLEEGVLVIATHSWHLMETVSRGALSQEDVANGIECLRRTLIELDDEIGFETLGRLVDLI